MTVSTCHACTSPNSVHLLSADGGNLSVERCLSCGFVYLASWQRSLEKFGELYDYYARLSEEDLARRYSPENRTRQRELLETLAGYTRGRKLLDVGCGEGQLLETAKNEGWDSVGLDLSETAIRLCRQRGLSASQTDFFDSSLDRQRFDAVIMSELLEHVPSPGRFLKRAEELLEENGILYLTTPNFGSLARRTLGGAWSVIHAEHIGYFERTTLRQMASEQTGLREIRIEANNITPSTFVAWFRRRGAQSVEAAATVHRKARRSLDQQLRSAVHQSRVLGASKKLANRAISRAGLGDTLVAWLQKPANPTARGAGAGF
ncbi:MAG: class I SAM-dependent methyltransferase [Myxococcales bacterium]|nr:class I SAM-dependent methyltransferase [Myxococcales bacterium]